MFRIAGLVDIGELDPATEARMPRPSMRIS
jgi:hypothetical protein